MIDVRHNGTDETVLTNRSDQPIAWIARFGGQQGQLRVGDVPLETHRTIDRAGAPVLWGLVTVAPGTAKTVGRTISP